MRNIPTYEEFTEGKKLTYKQHQAKRKKYEDKYGLNQPIEEGQEEPKPRERYGVCECGNASFSLSLDNHDIIRTCKNKDCQRTKRIS